MKRSYKLVYLFVFLAFHGLVIAQSKEYRIYIYDTIEGMVLKIDNNSLSVKSVNFGKFLLKEPLNYKKQSFEKENNLINTLLLQSHVDISDGEWKDSVELIDGVLVKIRFLYAKKDTLDQEKPEQETLLYRLDIQKHIAKEGVDDINPINLALIESSVRKIWIDEDDRSIVKLSLMYNGILYTIKQK